MRYIYLNTHYIQNKPNGNWVKEHEPDRMVWELLTRQSGDKTHLELKDETGKVIFTPAKSLLSVFNSINTTIAGSLNQDILVPFQESLKEPPKQISFFRFVNANHNCIHLNFDNDLVVQYRRKSIDITGVHKRGLFFVNGLIHATTFDTYDTSSLKVIDGVKTVVTSGAADISYMAFGTRIDVAKIPFRDLTITIDKENNELIIKGLKEEVLSRLELISVGGILVTLSTDPLLVKRINLEEETLVLNLELMDIPTKIIETSRFLDLSSLELDSETEIDSEAVTLKFLSLSNSFVIDVIMPKESLINFSLPVFYNESKKSNRVDSDINSLLFTKYGRISNYYIEDNGESTNLVVSEMRKSKLKPPKLFTELKGRYPEQHSFDDTMFDVINHFTSIGYT